MITTIVQKFQMIIEKILLENDQIFSQRAINIESELVSTIETDERRTDLDTNPAPIWYQNKCITHSYRFRHTCTDCDDRQKFSMMQMQSTIES